MPTELEPIAADLALDDQDWTKIKSGQPITISKPCLLDGMQRQLIVVIRFDPGFEVRPVLPFARRR